MMPLIFLFYHVFYGFRRFSPAAETGSGLSLPLLVGIRINNKGSGGSCSGPSRAEFPCSPHYGVMWLLLHHFKVPPHCKQCGRGGVINKNFARFSTFSLLSSVILYLGSIINFKHLKIKNQPQTNTNRRNKDLFICLSWVHSIQTLYI